jgi:hypothetical protein
MIGSTVATFDENVMIEQHRLVLRDGSGADVVELRASNAHVTVGADGNGGRITVQDGGGRPVVDIASGSATMTLGVEGNEGDLVVLDASGRETLRFNGATAHLTLGAAANSGRITVVDTIGQDVLVFDGDAGTLVIGGPNTNGGLRIHDLFSRSTVSIEAVDVGDGTSQGSLTVGNEQCEGRIHVRDSRGQNVLHFHADDGILIIGGQGTEGDVYVRDDTDTDRIHLNGADGDIILSGADVAEDFGAPGAHAPLDPGTVVVAVGADEIATACAAMDRRVVGVVSGAGAFRPAVRLGSRPGTGRVPVAIAGRVYCKADPAHGPIRAGDLLSTSATPGHAQRIDDPAGAAGAILGKALEPLRGGAGLVPVLLMLG